MLPVSRNLALALTLTLAVALAGCGGDDKKTTSTTTTPTVAATTATTSANALSATQFTGINKAAEEVVKDLADIGQATTKCASTSKDAKKISACVSDRLGTATTELNALADQVRGVGDTVAGPCRSSLRAFADDVQDLGTSFKSAAKSLVAGDTTKATSTLKALPLQAVQTTGDAAQTACKPGN